ncbi:MAG: hypothetical protein ACRC8S_15280 [Fimbriiglobus sp.]
MTDTDLVRTLAGLQLSILVASSLVPFRLDWKRELASLPKLHYQMYFIYGAYVVLNILGFGILELVYAEEIAAGSGLARAVCGFIALFWGIRLCLQPVLDAKPYLTAWWLKLGYHTLTVWFILITLGHLYLTFKP